MSVKRYWFKAVAASVAAALTLVGSAGLAGASQHGASTTSTSSGGSTGASTASTPTQPATGAAAGTTTQTGSGSPPASGSASASTTAASSSGSASSGKTAAAAAQSPVRTTANVRATAVGGPVILGGDDLTDHGDFDAVTNQNLEGWLYIQRALENIKPRVTRANDNSVAALGSSETGGGAGEAIMRAATAAALTVSYHNTGAGISAFFAALGAGQARPAILWISGNDASNDLSDDPTEAQALTANAVLIADFVNSGGGLLSHGTEYGWLSALLPGARSVESGGGDLVLTPEGRAAFPGVTENDLNAGPWHSHFEGNLGGLQVLVRYMNPDDPNDPLNGVPVVIGGAAVQLPGTPQPPAPPVPPQVGGVARLPGAPLPRALAPAPQVRPLLAARPLAEAPGLPVTGLGTGTLTVVALALLAIGAALAWASGRRWSSPPGAAV